MSNAFAKGSTVYNSDGQEAQYVADLGDEGHLVRPVLDGGEDFYPGSVVLWDDVLGTPPKLAYAEELRQARAELDDVTQRVAKERQALYQMQAERRELKSDHSAVLARIKEHRQLARIDDWIAGKVTHFVVWEHYGKRVEVKTWAEVMKDGERRRDHIPLLVLNGTLEWVEDYARLGVEWCVMSQGSSSTMRVIPCGSEEQARACAIEAVQALAALTMRERRNRGGDGYNHEIEQIVESMRKLGMEPAGDMASAYQQSRMAGAQTLLSNARKAADRAQKELADAEQAALLAGSAA